MFILQTPVIPVGLGPRRCPPSPLSCPTCNNLLDSYHRSGLTKLHWLNHKHLCRYLVHLNLCEKGKTYFFPCVSHFYFRGQILGKCFQSCLQTGGEREMKGKEGKQNATVLVSQSIKTVSSSNHSITEGTGPEKLSDLSKNTQLVIALPERRFQKNF